MNNENQAAVRVLDILPQDATKGNQNSGEFKSLPLYTVIEDGVIKTNIGIKSDQNDILVYDVTNASQELREKYKESIIEYPVKKVIGTKPQKEAGLTKGKIITVLSLLGEYQNLTQRELDSIGHDYVVLESTEEGLRVTPLLRKKYTFSGDTYLRIDPSILDESLQSKIAEETTELVQLENGLYEQKGLLKNQKEL